MKYWGKPEILTVVAKELQGHVKAAARSIGCGNNDGR